MIFQFFAPFTGGAERTMPPGLRFVIDNDPADFAEGVRAKPEPYADWESELVPDEDRASGKYAGYHLVIKFDDLDKFCEKLTWRGSTNWGTRSSN